MIARLRSWLRARRDRGTEYDLSDDGFRVPDIAARIGTWSDAFHAGEQGPSFAHRWFGR